MRPTNIVNGLGLILSCLLFLTPSAEGQTIPHDSNGNLFAGCAYIDQNGVGQICGPNFPLPMTSQPVLDPNGDVYGWGRNWFASPTSLGAITEIVGGFFIDNYSVVGWSRTGNSIQQIRSTDGGRSYTNVGNTQALASGAEFAARANNGNFVMGLRTTFQVATNGFTFVNATMTGTGPEVPRAFGVSGGGTILSVGDSFPVAGNNTICRSTNSGATFNCAQPAGGMAGALLFSQPGGQHVASVTGTTWITAGERGGNSEALISTDDGVTWTSKATIAQGNGTSGVGCLTSLICLWGNGQNIIRSTDGGNTWGTGTPAFTSGDANSQISGFAIYNSTTVTAFSTATAVFYRSVDAGLTWAPLVAPQCPGAGTVPVRVPAGQNVKQGRAILLCSSTSGSGILQYSPSLGTNAAVLTGADGNQGKITTNGEVVVGGAGTAGTPSTATVSVQGPGAGATAQPVVFQQGLALFNTQATSGANAAQTLAVSGAAGQRSTLRAAMGSVNAGTCTVTIQDGVTTIMTLPALTSTTQVNLFPAGVMPASGISASTGNALNVVIGACGVGNTSTVAIVGDRS